MKANLLFKVNFHLISPYQSDTGDT